MVLHCSCCLSFPVRKIKLIKIHFQNKTLIWFTGLQNRNFFFFNTVVVFAILDMNQPWIYLCSPSWSPLLPPTPSQPSGSSQCTSPEHLSHASNLGCWSVSPLIVYLFQCCSLRTSHSCLLPQSLKVCSVHLCLFFCTKQKFQAIEKLAEFGGKTRINTADFEKMKFQAILKPMEMLKWQSLPTTTV